MDTNTYNKAKQEFCLGHIDNCKDYFSTNNYQLERLETS